MRTDFVAAMGPRFADENGSNQTGGGTKDPTTRKTPVNPNPTPKPDAGKK
ncbi:MAG TPA: hypothetical protein VKM72_26530 [Thermoanaerobaculia bacterium]|nr:hypothetical protein [Thermoanaerobaculia bacterium]